MLYIAYYDSERLKIVSIAPETVIVANRFGLGAKPGDLQQIGNNPREWLLTQIEQPQPLSKSTGEVPDSKTALSLFFDFRNTNRNMARNGSNNVEINPNEVMKLGQQLRPLYLKHVSARAIQAIRTETPFYERLVHFWSNHFAVSVKSPQMLGIVGAFEFEAIRQNITGNFYDLLLAVEKHPTVLTFLDNQFSIGANSTLAKQAKRGRRRNRKFDINENLAREILELHTMGVSSGYTQEDVTTFAKAISGWTYNGVLPGIMNTGPVGEFKFNPIMHEPGSKTVLDKKYSQSGIKQDEAVLKDLSLHSATARHLSTKLARHFIADDPPESAINRISKAYLDSNGHLPIVYNALVNSNEAWQDLFPKFKTPEDFIFSTYRAINIIPKQPQQLIQPLTLLGQQPFQSGSPAGWPDTPKEWSAGEALFKRIELSTIVANRIGNRIEPNQLANEILGPLLGDHTLTAITRAESASQGLALLLASLEFQRR